MGSKAILLNRRPQDGRKPASDSKDGPDGRSQMATIYGASMIPLKASNASSEGHAAYAEQASNSRLAGGRRNPKTIGHWCVPEVAGKIREKFFTGKHLNVLLRLEYGYITVLVNSNPSHYRNWDNEFFNWNTINFGNTFTLKSFDRFIKVYLRHLNGFYKS